MANNILIVEDDSFTRFTLEFDLKNYKELNIIGSLKNGKEAVEFIKKIAPDTILMDIDMPVMNGIEATKYIKEYSPDIKVIILTSYKEKQNVIKAFSSGANAYCVKNIRAEELLNVINIINNNGIWFDQQIAKFIFDILKDLNIEEDDEKTENTKSYNITKRERNIIKLIAEGYSNAEISEQLVISKNTVKNHVSNIIKKLSVNDRTQIALLATKENLLK